jgi:hypothetical protein
LTLSQCQISASRNQVLMPMHLQTGSSSCVPMSSYPMTTIPFASESCLGSIAGAVGAGIGACTSAAATALIELNCNRKENMMGRVGSRTDHSTRGICACTTEFSGRRSDKDTLEVRDLVAKWVLSFGPQLSCHFKYARLSLYPGRDGWL